MENLVVRTYAPDENGVERYAVVAGDRRRLKAMQALAGEGVIDADHPVPCLVRADDIEPAKLSLAENVVCITMCRPMRWSPWLDVQAAVSFVLSADLAFARLELLP